MRMTYSLTADALAIRLGKGKGPISTVELGGGVNVDYDGDERPVAIEILGASRYYPRAELEQLAQPVHLLTLAEAAAESKLAASTLKNQILAGRLPATKRGRDWVVARHDLWNYLESRAPQGRPGRSARAKPAARRKRKVSA